MIRTLLCVLAVVLALPLAAPAQETPFAPVAVVNGDPITRFDVDQRARLLVALADTQATGADLTRAALDQLIEDRLKVQEGERRGLTVSDAGIEGGIEQLAEQNGTTAEALKATLSRNGVSELALRDLMAAEVTWLEVVRTRFASRVDPTETEVEAEIGLIGQARGAPEGVTSTSYRLQEIGIAAEGQDAAARAQAEQIRAEIAAGAEFSDMVQQYSTAPSAAEDGIVGWVDASGLPPDLQAELARLQIGQVTQPLRVSAGWSLVKLLEVRQDAASDAMRDQVRRRMIEQRAGRLSEGLLQELRRDALIELK